MKPHLQFDIYQSPLGEIYIVVDQEQLVFLDFNDNNERIQKLLKRRFGEYELTHCPGILAMRSRLDRYFEGDWGAFHGLDMSTGGTEFQKTVWDGLTTIPRGGSVSYDQLARDIGNPKAVRAAASANASNPISIIIPCHRVIGKNGAMRGYAGGIERKVWLLRHEGAII